MKKLILMAAAACFCLIQAAAQENLSQRPAHFDSLPGRAHRLAEVPNPEKTAKAEADRLQKKLHLTDKQYKKIYKLILKEQKERLANRPSMFGGGRGNMPPRGGGMRPQMPQGGDEDFSAFNDDGSFPPQMPMKAADKAIPFRDNPQERTERRKKIAEKYEKKIKKILTDEQFTQWKEMQPRTLGGHPEGKRSADKHQQEEW